MYLCTCTHSHLNQLVSFCANCTKWKIASTMLITESTPRCSECCTPMSSKNRESNDLPAIGFQSTFFRRQE